MFVVGAIVASLTNARASVSAAAANTVLLMAAIVLATALHEAAHAGVAWAIGLHVHGIFLGRGRAVWQGEWCGIFLLLQVVPFTGITLLSAPSARWLRARLMATYAAGPLSNAALLACMMYWLATPDRERGLAISPSPLLAFAFANGALAFFSALPIPPTRPVHGRPLSPGTDGWNLLALPFRSDEELRPVVVANVLFEAQRLMTAQELTKARALLDDALGRSPRLLLARMLNADWFVAAERWADAAKGLRAILADPLFEPAVGRAGVVLRSNNLAWADFMLDDPELLDEADRHSSVALAATPNDAALLGTRGAVLLARGDLVGAEEALLASLARNPVTRNRALNSCCLAILYARRGTLDAARSALDEARAQDPACSLLSRAEAALVK
jgi:tetratricopeptide (TPR) repeat protein